MEDNAIRALIIGVMLFVLIITITAISVYYTTSVKQAQLLNTRTDYGTVYEKNIEELNGKIVNGTECVNIIRKYFEKYSKIDIIIDDDSINIYKDSKHVDSIKNISDQTLLKFDAGEKYKIECVKIFENVNKISVKFTKQ